MKKYNSYRLFYVVKLLTYVKEFVWEMVLYLICGGIYRIIPIVSAALTAYMIGHVGSGGTIEAGFIVLIAVIAALRGVFSYLDCIISHDIAYRILSKFRVLLFEAIERLSPSNLSTKRTGELISTTMNDVELLEWFYAHVVGVFLLSIIIPIGTIVFLWNIHPFIAVAVVPWICIVVFIPKIFKKKADIQGNEVRDKHSNIKAASVDGIQGLKDIIAFNWKDSYINKFKVTASEYEEANIRYSKRKGTENFFIKIFIAMSMLSVLVTSAFLFSNGLITIEWYMVAVILSGAVFAPISEIMNMSSQFGLIFSSAKRVDDILKEKSYVNQENAKPYTAILEPVIQFKNVTFRYPGQDKNALNNLNFTVKAGEKLAIIGSSGAGKTTCGKLLMKFWQPDEGRISIGGVDLQDIDGESVRRQISTVSQDVYLLSRSIKDNIKLGHNYSDQEIFTAAKKASIHELISSLPDGYDTKVGERGTKLSGGEKQRISIARALLKDASILILDESSSNLDSINEKIVNESLITLMEDKTTIVIAHSLSTIKLCDRILILDNGFVAEEGTLKELMNSSKSFRRIINKVS